MTSSDLESPGSARRAGGRLPITLVIESIAEEGTAKAWYFYESQRKAIPLPASLAADWRLVLAEEGARFALRATTEAGLVGE